MKPYRIEILPSAQKELSSLPKIIQKRIAGKIDLLKVHPRPQDARTFKGTRREVYRLRIGDYRVLYQIRDEILLILVIKIGHRREVVRRMGS